MANTPSGTYYPVTGSAVQVPQDFLALATSIEGRVIPSVADTTTRNSVLAAMTTAQKRGAVMHIAGYGWMGFDGTTWQDFDNNKIKAGRTDGVVQSNTYMSIPAADCFFAGVAPRAIVVSSAMGPTFAFSQMAYDGNGALIRGFDIVAGAYLGTGAAAAVNWISVK